MTYLGEWLKELMKWLHRYGQNLGKSHVMVKHLGLSIAGRGKKREGRGRKALERWERWPVMGIWQVLPCRRGHPLGAMSFSYANLCSSQAGGAERINNPSSLFCYPLISCQFLPPLKLYPKPQNKGAGLTKYKESTEESGEKWRV